MHFKNNFKKVAMLLFSAFALVLVLAGCGSKSSSSSSDLRQPKTLTIGMEGTYPPFGYRDDNGKLVGLEADLARDIAHKLNLKPKFVLTSKWDGLIAGLGSHKYDVVFNNLSINKQREENFQMSKPYIYSKTALITRSNDKSITNIKDIKGKKFAEGTGTDNEQIAEKFGAKTFPSSEFATTAELIKQGRVDGAVHSVPTWNSYAKSNSTKGLTMREVPYSEQAPGQIGAMIGKQSPQLKNKINKAIQELRDDGTLTKLSDHYFGNDISKK